jgi:hypothetical protein
VVCSDRLNRDMVQVEHSLSRLVRVGLAEDVLNRLVHCAIILVSVWRTVVRGEVHTAVDGVGILVC